LLKNIEKQDNYFAIVFIAPDEAKYGVMENKLVHSYMLMNA